MIKNSKILEKFEQQLAKENNCSFNEKFKLYDEMWKWAKMLNKSLETSDGIETRIRISKILNSEKCSRKF